MFYYILREKLLISKVKYYNLNSTTQREAEKYKGMIFALNKLNPEYSRRSFSVSHENFLFLKDENLDLLVKPTTSIINVPHWLKLAINDNRVTSLNTKYPSWQDVLTYNPPKK
ncbi:hypothetical protein [Clostridium sp.]|uniref:hypothetical protein n=1 Tax=Clostridium sp. TaxID=1506 RepID=UPI00345BE8A3